MEFQKISSSTFQLGEVMRFNNKGFTLAELFVSGFFVFVIFVFTGWGINIYKLTKCDFQAPYKAEIIRGVGLIPPVGGIIGWLKIEDK